MTAQKKPRMRILGVCLNKQKVFFFYTPVKENFFLVNSSSDGLNFTLFNDEAEIRDKNGESEDINRCQDFRISEIEGINLLTYKLQAGRKTSLSAAFSKDLIHWQKIGPISTLKETGMLIPRFKYKNKFFLYAAEKSIKIASSYDLKTFTVTRKPVYELPKNQSQQRLKIGTILLTTEGILLLYYLVKKIGKLENFALKALLFDRQNPQKILWQSKKPIWQQKEEWPGQKIIPLGIIKRGSLLLSYWQDEKGEIFSISHLYSSLFTPTVRKTLLTSSLKKFKENPILKPIQEHDWESQAVFNPAAVYEADKVHLVYRAVGGNGVSVLGYATAKDGFNIDERLPQPIYSLHPPYKGDGDLPHWAYASGGCYGGCEDPRITKIDSRFYMTFVSCDGKGPPRIALTSITEDDFLNHRWHWKKSVLISPPNVVDKNACILPEKINGKYVIFHRIFPNILVDFVDSLEFNGKKFLKGEYTIKPRRSFWDSRKIGMGPPPIKTDEGWLAIYHAVDNKDPSRYKIGAMLLDLKDPTEVKLRSRYPILEPTENYENEGLKYGVAYPCGAAAINDKLFLYYGGADMVTCAATVKLDKLLSDLKNQSSANYIYD